ncbi:arginine deiminase [Atopococcus tabaci]|uniref:arginine deiminase n=1 Tax=Atopococcus tabaci TaxID=269774 RepID=UPI0003FE90F6|nr:arginine deiminase [Atopococcus tabaci]
MQDHTKPVHVFSEIGELQTVLVRRPGREVENMTPQIMERLLFDDIPYLPAIQNEHDAFVKVLRENGAEVVYLEKLTAEAVDAGQVKEEFVDAIVEESYVASQTAREAVKTHLMSLDTPQLVDEVMAGIRKKDIPIYAPGLFELSKEDDNPFYLNPMPSLYFTRDPAVVLGNGLTINSMKYEARVRESLFMEYIVKHHPRFAGKELPIYHGRESVASMEGGDMLVLSPQVLAIGISQRTSAAAIEELAQEIFRRNLSFEKILAIKIPNVRAMMHLDTVFTMVDHDKFTIHPGILNLDGSIDTYILEKGDEEGTFAMTHQTDLQEVLKEALGLDDLVLIPCGGGDEIVAPREQWTDGSNTLAIAPGVVVTYDRNYVTNDLLRQHGIKVIEIASSELSRGRGGPRCMSMPLVRKDIKQI